MRTRCEQRQRPGARVSPADPFVPQDGFRDLVAEGVDRIEGEQRLLEDHRHDGAAEIRQLAAAHRQHIAAGDGNAALDPGPVLRMQAEERAQGDALAGARLADQGDDLARSHVEIDAVDGAHRLRPAGEGDLEILDGDEACGWLHGITPGCGASPATGARE